MPSARPGLLLVSLALALASTPALAATFVVTKIFDTDDGDCSPSDCSLREAVAAANATAAADTIVFDIRTPVLPAQKRIVLNSPLRIEQPLLIYGHSQTGSSSNTDPDGFNAVLNIRISAGSLAAGASLMEVERPGVVGAGEAHLQLLGVELLAPQHSALRIGRNGRLSLSGSLVSAAVGVELSELAGSSQIGGDAMAQRVHLRDADTAIRAEGSADNAGLLVVNNIFSHFHTGLHSRRGAIVRRNRFLPGDPDGHSVVLATSASGGVGLGAGLSFVFRNVFGLNADGSVTGSNRVALWIGAGSGSFLGGATVGDSTQLQEANVFAGYTEAAILITAGERHAVAGNRFLEPLGADRTSIDLSVSQGPDGHTPNDFLDTDAGPNGLQNAPLMLSAERAGADLPVLVTGSLHSVPNASYRIVFYGSALAGGSGFGPGQDIAPNTLVLETDVLGDASFGPFALDLGTETAYVTATATRLSGLGHDNDTSELSNAVPVVPQVPFEALVTTTANSGPGSLRAAIETINQGPLGVTNRIRFDIPVAGGLATLTLADPLPAIQRPVLIDGLSQPGSSPNTLTSRLADNAELRVVLVNALPTNVPSLKLQGSGIEVRGLVFLGTPGGGIAIDARGSHHRLCGNHFGQHPDGSIQPSQRAVLIAFADGLRLGGPEAHCQNVFVGAPEAAVISGADQRIEGNLFGLRTDGSLPTELRMPRALDLTGSGEIRDNVFAGADFDPPFFESGTVLLRQFTGLLADNAIGVSADGSTPYSATTGLRIRDSMGVRVESSDRPIAHADTAIVLTGDNRDIRLQQPIRNVGAGVRVTPGSEGVYFAAPVQTTDNVGFDLVANDDLLFGVTPNDIGDVDDGPNGLQNFPELLLAERQGSSVVVAGVLDSTADAHFRLLICGLASQHASGHGGCDRILLAQEGLTTDSSGRAAFALLLPDVPDGLHYLVASVASVDEEGRLSSSEFSPNIPILGPGEVFMDGFE